MKLNLQTSILLLFFIFFLSNIGFGQKNQIPSKLNKVSNQVQKGNPANYKNHGVIKEGAKKINPINGYDITKLKAMEARLKERGDRLRNEAIQYCLANNIPLRKTLPDGRIAEIKMLAENNYPIYYITTNDDAAISTRADYLNTGGGLGLDLNGNDITVHVWDGGHALNTHQEYDGAGGTNRVTVMDDGTEPGGLDYNFHATHVTGTICASGVQAAAKGMAWQSDVRSYKWNADDSEAAGQTTAPGINNGFGMLLSNHSYGYGASGIPDSWFGQYGSDAQIWDDMMYNAPYYLMVNSAGNDGNDNGSNASPLEGNSSYDKLNGMSTAKNNFVIANGNDANINPDGSLSSVTRNSSSSEGPTDDLRIKPDIMGNGTSLYSTLETSNTAYGNLTGTSMSAPNVTGTLTLLQEHYYNLHSTYMRAATLKGLALHTADDVTPSNSNASTASLVGPDATTGWGLLNAKFAAETLTTAAASSGSAIVEELTLTQGQTYQITVQSNGSDPLMASISWTDPARTPISGTNSSTPALVNDLDLNVSNGSTFYPWRLTSITTNATDAENNVDPFERVDVAGASGSYTITVTHDGTLTNGAQDYTLIVTGIVVASTPLISFGNTVDTINEDTNCNHTDIIVPLNIAQGASADADVNFAVNGSSTATSLLDFELLTPSVTFPAGSTASQDMVLRVFHDSFIESAETVIIDFTVNANGGDASEDTNADTFTLTIQDDDITPSTNTDVTLYFEDFDDGAYDATTSGNGTVAWSVGNAASASSTYWNTTGNTTLFAFTNDDDCNCDKSNDHLTTTVIDLSGSYNSVTLTFDHAFADVVETGTVQISTDGTNFTQIATLSNTSTNNGGGSYTTPWVNGISIDLSTYIGEPTVFIDFFYNDGGNWAYGMAVDNIEVIGSVTTGVQTAVNSGTPDQINLMGTGSAFSSDPTSGDVMAEVTNNDSFDYGCVSLAVSRSGTGAQSYNGSAFPNHVMDKTFAITPSNTTSAGNTSVTFYFEEAEIAGWEAATGLSRNSLVIGRGTPSSITETSAVSIGAFGTHVTLTGNFSGLDGTYYFGPLTAFIACPGVTKTWNGSSWTPSGVPDSTNPVIIAGNYNTNIHGNLEACVLTINAGNTLTIAAANYAQVQGNITIAGDLVIEHQGSLVQIDDDATVVNTGSIDVQVSTPNLASRDFMLMGSPTSAELRTGVWGSAFLVLNHHTENFIPNPDVAAAFPLAENFADDNYDNWQQYHVGPINVGEGYIVRPQTGYGQPGGVFNYNYTQGTLNNGVVNFTVLYNGTKNASPNILANPYASAIWADDFINANAMVDEVYFWEHNTPPSPSLPGAGSMNFSMEDISMYNLGGGVAAASGGTAPNGYISTAQGFAIKANAAGTAIFNNSMRRIDNNNTLRIPSTDRDRIWLKVNQSTYDIGATALIGFSDVTTNGIDNGYDSRRLATAVSLYSHLQDGSSELGIQTLAAFHDRMKVPLGFTTQLKASLEYTISIDHLEGGNVEGISIYLADNLLGTVTDLTLQEYVFRANEGSQHNRFTLFFERTTLGNPTVDLNRIALYPNPTRDIVYIASPVAQIEKVVILDLQGRLIQEINANHDSFTKLSLGQLSPSVYFVKVQTSEGSITKRIIKN